MSEAAPNRAQHDVDPSKIQEVNTGVVRVPVVHDKEYRTTVGTGTGTGTGTYVRIVRTVRYYYYLPGTYTRLMNVKMYRTSLLLLRYRISRLYRTVLPYLPCNGNGYIPAGRVRKAKGRGMCG